MLLPQDLHKLETLISSEACEGFVEDNCSGGAGQGQDQLDQVSLASFQLSNQAPESFFEPERVDHSLDMERVNATNIDEVSHGLRQGQVGAQDVVLEARRVSRVDWNAAIHLLLEQASQVEGGASASQSAQNATLSLSTV